MESRFLEIRRDGRTLRGVGMPYGDIARMPWGQETFEAGAFGDIASADVILNFMHNRERPLARTGGGLILLDSPEQLLVSATLPNTRDADDALELVDNRTLRGFSVEFAAMREVRRGNLRVLQRAHIGGIGLVDRPAYPKAIVEPRFELRQDGRGVGGKFFYDVDSIISGYGQVQKQRIKPGAFNIALEEEMREISLVLYDESRPLASRRKGTLKLTNTDEYLEFEVDRLPGTSYAEDFRIMMRDEVADFGIVPLFDVQTEGITEEPDSDNPEVFRRVVSSAVLTALAIVMNPPQGNPGEVEERAEELVEKVEIAEIVAEPVRRRKIWL